jgi:peptidyl-prolyl cis-trans isomerase D
MRKHARSSFIKIVFWMLIIVFVSWGVGIMVGGGNKMNVAANVDGEAITAQEYTRAYENMQRVYQQLYRENFNPQVMAQLNLHQRALDNLVTDLLLRREAQRLGLSVSDDEVRDAILNVPNFQSDGQFDRARYLATLRGSRLTPAEFEESQRETLLVTKLESLLTDGLSVSDRELHDLYALENEKIDVAFVKIPYAKYHDTVPVSDTEIHDFYEKNQEAFRQPERVTLTYVAYTPETLAAAVPVSDEAVTAYYETHQGDYETPEKIRVRSIVFVVPADADDAKKTELRDQAARVLEEARGGGDFAALARTYSGDPLTKDAGGDLGLVERGKLESEVEEAAFAVETGQVTDVVETGRGFQILKVEEKQPTGVRPLAEVRDDIVRTLKETGADEAARAAVDADLARAREGAALEELAKARGLSAITSPSVSRGDPLEGVKTPALVVTALSLDTDAADEVVGTEPPYYLVKVKEKTPSTITPLEGARAKIVETLRSQKAKEAAHADADAVLAAARADGGTDALAKTAQAKGYKIEETGPFARNEPIPKLSGAPIKDELFALTSDAPIATRAHDLPDGAVVLALKERIAPDDAAFTDKSDTIRDGAISRKRAQVLESYRNMLRQRADISINPDIVTGART